MISTLHSLDIFQIFIFMMMDNLELTILLHMTEEVNVVDVILISAKKQVNVSNVNGMKNNMASGISEVFQTLLSTQ